MNSSFFFLAFRDGVLLKPTIKNAIDNLRLFLHWNSEKKYVHGAPYDVKMTALRATPMNQLFNYKLSMFLIAKFDNYKCLIA